MADFTINVPSGVDLVVIPEIYGLDSSGARVPVTGKAYLGSEVLGSYSLHVLNMPGPPTTPTTKKALFIQGAPGDPALTEDLVTVTLHMKASDGSDVIKTILLHYGPEMNAAVDLHLGTVLFLNTMFYPGGFNPPNTGNAYVVDLGTTDETNW